MKRPGFVRAVTAAAILALSPAVPLPADEVPPRFEGGVEVVAVDATVVDGKGRPVGDLTPAEFLVKVDGRMRRVLSADFVELRGSAASATPVPAGAIARTEAASAGRREGRRIVLVVDRGQPGGSVRLATDAAARLLGQLGPEDQVALFSLPAGPRLDFTTDHAALQKAFGRIGPIQAGFMSEFNLTFAEALLFTHGRHRTRVAERECEKWLEDRPNTFEQCQQRVEAEGRRQVEEHERGVQDRLNALEALCRSLAQIPGPKTLVLISGGLTAAMSGGRVDVLHHLRRITAAAAASRVSLYSIYFSQRNEGYGPSVGRVPYSADMEEDRRLRSAGLGELTGMAGGALFEVVAGAEYAFERVAAETSAYYLLGLDPEKRDRDGKPHDIEVKVARKGVEVRARRQFVMNAATPGPVKVPARAMAPPLPPSPLRVATHVLRGASAEQITVVMAAQVDGFSDAHFDIKVLDPTGRVVGSLAEHVAPDSGRPVRHQETILLPRGLYTLRAEAVEAGGRQALLVRPLNAELSHGVGFDVSDLLLLESVDEKMRLSATGSIASDTMAAYLELYVQEELPTERLGVTVEIVGPDGKRRSATRLSLQKDAAKGLLFAEGIIDLFTLPPGSYVARAHVTFGTNTSRRVERAFEYKGPQSLAPPVIHRSPPVAVNTPASVRGLERLREGERLLALDKFDDAARAFQEAITFNPFLVMGHYGLGTARMGLKEYALAVPAFEAARAAFHDRAKAMGKNRIETNDTRQNAIRRNELYMRSSTGGQERGQWAMLDALAEMSAKGGKGSPQFPSGLSLALGSAYFRVGRLADAEREYRAAIEADPKLGEPHSNLAVILLMTGRVGEAKEQLTLAEQKGFRPSAGLQADIEKARVGAPAQVP